MHLLQRAKATTPLLPKTRVTRLSLLLASLLLFSAVLALFGGAGTAHAASHASVKPASVHGGGCSSNYWVDPCISVNSAGLVVPDAYIEHTYTDVYGIYLLRDGSTWTSDVINQAFSAGTHLYGFAGVAYPGHTWQTLVIVRVLDFPTGSYAYAYIYSPTQYT
jgi:hypothetical protein